jgi:hypothetical protein
MDPSRVSELLFGGRGEAVDADVLAYLASFEHDEDEDEEEAVRTVQELCASASPAFAALPQEEVTRRVLAFLSECRGEGEGGAERSTSITADAAAAAAAAALAAALANLGAADNDDDDVGARGSSGGASLGTGSSGGGSSSESADGALAAAVGALADLMPAASCSDRAEARSFARYVLRERFGGDPDAAADWMLAAQVAEVEEQSEEEDKEEGDDRAAAGAAGTMTTTTRLCAAVVQWRRVAKQREEEQRREALARERDRQATLERFAWRPDGAGSGGGGGGGSRPLPPPAPKGASAAAAAAPRVRYLDGAPVTTKGEKYVVVSQKEEWDGGSRGRVKTKGKRGVGFA